MTETEFATYWRLRAQGMLASDAIAIAKSRPIRFSRGIFRHLSSGVEHAGNEARRAAIVLRRFAAEIDAVGIDPVEQPEK